MVHTFDGFNEFIRLQKGERLSDFLANFPSGNFPGAWVNGLGGVSEVTLGFYDLTAKEYHWKIFEGLREMTALQGNLAYDESGKLILHAHGTFADAQYKSVGGHVKDFVTAGTVELFLHRSYKPLNRNQDKTVGLPLLDL